ncbi:MAG TPA: DNA repair protein RecN [Smithellaceae bacterium]|nr:DNA repair protein RecN [Smithellaceae bacterium]HQM45744.1 DNA repair protein RecN [Smithellaceae bacterium]
MLHELSITNFAIIDELHITFNDGLNIISGETGAGKSILIGAVSLLLGDRATAEMIRFQADTATVEALFSTDRNQPLQETLAAMGFVADRELVIRRIISRSGRNKVLINGQLATLAHLAQISESLINICGQHEHQILLRAENHIDILDEFGGCLDVRAGYEKVYDRYQQIINRLDELEKLRRHRADKMDLISYQLREIQEIQPIQGEDDQLADEKKVLAGAQKLASWSNKAFALLYADKGCIGDQLKDVLSAIREIRKIDGKFIFPVTDLENCYAVLQEAALVLRDYEQKLVFDPERLAAIDERLDALNRLKRKHGGTMESLLNRKREIEEELRQVTGIEEESAQLTLEKNAIVKELSEKALALSLQRVQASESLNQAVDREISDLNMPHASFITRFLRRFTPSDNLFGPKGGDDVEFYLAANAGEEPKPLNKIASGGELSRIVLALKNVLSQTGSATTSVFDEVDSGIGGATAEIVGRKLKEISKRHQVICITHLPQIASFGDRHLRVAKQVIDGRTATKVEMIEHDDKIEEISRMLGGVNVTDTARNHARAMLAAARAARLASDQGKGGHVKKSAHQ